MMTLTEKAAYIKGLVEGLELDGTTKEAKIIKALVDIVDDITLSLADAEDDIAVLADEIDELEEHLNAVDVDLAEVEEILYEEYEDEDGQTQTITEEYGHYLLFGKNTTEINDTVEFMICPTHDVYEYLKKRQGE